MEDEGGAIKTRKEVTIRSKESWYDGTIVQTYQAIEEKDPVVEAEELRLKQIADEEKKLNKKKGAAKEENKKQEVSFKKKNPARTITYVKVGFRIYCKEG